MQRGSCTNAIARVARPGVRTTWSRTVAAVVAATVAASAFAAPPWTVEATPIELRFEGTGRLAAARKMPIRLVPKAFRGAFLVNEVLFEGGPVEAGDVLIRLETAEIEEALERARVELEEASLRLDLLREEQRIAEEAGLTSLERKRLAAERAEKALELHRETERDRQQRGAVLRLQGSEDSLTNQRQELEQLESMYAGTSLATETKDIVLERARRSMARAQESLALARIDHELFTSVQMPDRDRDVADRAESSAEELRHAEVSQRLDAIRRRLALAEATRRLEDLAERVSDLESDLVATEIVAPATGLLTAISLAPGDAVDARQRIAEVLDASAFSIETKVGAQELGWLESGASVDVSLPAVPGLAASGTIARLSRIGTADGTGAAFPAKVEVPAADPRMLIGLEAKVSATTRTAPVVAIPSAAVRRDGDRTFVLILLDGRESQREIVLGRTGTTLVEVLEGLEPGDRVLVPEAEPETSSGIAP
ncbi:MAG: HlyD family efflux transporter periplasmic adaptor subunit [Phycisphaerales bacterium]